MGNYLKEELNELVQRDSYIFDFIQAGSLDGLWYWDLDNPQNEWMSPKFWQTLGYDPAEKQHLSSEWQDIIFQEDLKMALVNFEKHCENPDYPYDQIVRYKHKNGGTIWIRCRGIAIRDANKKPIRMLGAHTDITALKQAEADIRRLSDEYEKVFNGTQDAMFLIRVAENNRFRFIRNNLSHQIKTKISLEQIRDKSPEELLGEELGRKVSENYQRCVDAGHAITYEEELDFGHDRRFWLTTLTPIVEDKRVAYIVGSAADITDRKRLELELVKNANYDELTGLPNRRLFFVQLEQILNEHHRDRMQFALFFIDIDGFKNINDSYGHEIGDKLLISVAAQLKNAVRKADFVARMGGDEFVVILRNIKDKEEVNRVASKMRAAIQSIQQIDQHPCAVDISMGIAIYPECGSKADELVRVADNAMYSVKRQGKGGTQFCS